MKNLRNITIADLRKILSIYGCTYARTKGGHEDFYPYMSHYD